MFDPNTVVGGGLALLASKDLLTKLLGPTAEYIGGEIKGLVEKCNLNIEDIFIRAYRKLGSNVEKPGAVNPRVLKNVFDDGKFCEDELSREYFAGVLASSRTKDGEDDRGVTNAKLVSNLSSYQIRTHYIFYTLLRRIFLPHGSIVSPDIHCQMMIMYIPSEKYYSAMGPLLTPSDDRQKISVLAHSMNGLRRNDLIEDKYVYGPPERFFTHKLTRKQELFTLNKRVLCEHGISFQPTHSGMEFYLCAHGLGDLDHFQFLDGRLALDPIEAVQIPNNVDLLYKSALEHLQKEAQNKKKVSLSKIS
jgi:hypothetical protein